MNFTSNISPAALVLGSLFTTPTPAPAAAPTAAPKLATVHARFLGPDASRPEILLFELTNATPWLATIRTTDPANGKRRVAVCSGTSALALPGERILPLIENAPIDREKDSTGPIENRYALDSPVSLLPGEAVILEIAATYFPRPKDVVWVDIEFSWQYECAKNGLRPVNEDLKVSLRIKKP